jgi:hypothetical protein
MIMSYQLKNFVLVFSFVSCAILLSGFLFPGRCAETCSPVLASLMPKGAVKITGRYMSSGMIGMGSAAAWLPFEHPCSNQTTKYPGHFMMDVQHYTGDGVNLLKMQVDSVEQQTLQNEKAENDKIQKKVRGSNSTLETINPVKAEF